MRHSRLLKIRLGFPLYGHFGLFFDFSDHFSGHYLSLIFNIETCICLSNLNQAFKKKIIKGKNPKSFFMIMKENYFSSGMLEKMLERKKGYHISDQFGIFWFQYLWAMIISIQGSNTYFIVHCLKKATMTEVNIFLIQKHPTVRVGLRFTRSVTFPKIMEENLKTGSDENKRYLKRVC